ncbi:MAG: hypothetical protein ACYTFI_18420 [Planctomycetota bacterium]|jgi:hypothetical protein
MSWEKDVTSPESANDDDRKEPAPRQRERRAGKRTSATGALFHDAARALGRTAGRARGAIERLGERGAVTLAVRKFQREKSERLKELGAVAREALAKPDGELRAGDPRVGELLHSLDRLDEKIERLTDEVETGAEDADEKPSEDAAEEADEKQ